MTQPGKQRAAAPVPRPQARRRGPRWLGLGGAIVLAVAIAALFFFWSGGSSPATHAYALAPESALPEDARKAPPKVREAYRFAIANREILRQIPCYCGCGAEHQSNAECYIKEVKSDGQITFDLMSYG